MFISGPLSLITRYTCLSYWFNETTDFSNTTILSSSPSLFWSVLEENELK